MAASNTFYNHFSLRVADLTNLLLASGTFKFALVSSAYTFSAAHTVWADASANEIADTGVGYTTGGIAVTPTLSTVTTNDFKFTFSNPVWTASGGDIPAWRYGILRRVGTINAMVDPLICAVLGNTTGPTDIPATTDGNTLTFTIDASGFITGTVA